MSFFDDDDFDEPTHVADAAPRRALRRPGGFGGFGGGGTGGSVDPHTARVRQMVALGIIVLVLILLTLAINGCVKSSRTSALKDYSRDVTAVLVESRDEVAVPLFKALSSGEQANTLTQTLNRLRETAESEADRVTSFSPPGNDDGKVAQHDLELAMNLRARAVRVIAEKIPAAKGDEDTSAAAANEIAGQMQAMLASDVIVQQRTKPLIDQALADADISGANVQAPRTVTDVSWLNPDTVLSNLSGGGGGSTSGGSSSAVRDRSKETPATAGTHGTAIVSTTMGDVTLTADGDNAVTGRQVQVQVENGGDTDESSIDVGATFTASGGKPAFVKKTIAALATGSTATVTLALPSSVKGGQAGELKIQVGGVPGEENLDNNSATYKITIGG